MARPPECVDTDQVLYRYTKFIKFHGKKPTTGANFNGQAVVVVEIRR